MCLSIICHVIEKNMIYPGLLSCFLVIIFDDMFLAMNISSFFVIA